MGKGWDSSGIAFSVDLWREVLRVLKPGGHMLAFGGTRTYHRMTCAIEDAGFEIRDSLHWFYGTGFPKSLDPARVIEMDRCVLAGVHCDKTLPKGKKAQAQDHLCPPIPEVQAQFGGGGTALKPAHEPIVLARKPLIGTVAANVLKYGTGALNIDASRIAGVKPQVTQGVNSNPTSFAVAKERRLSGDPNEGRWPANVLLDEGAAAELDEQSGESKSSVQKGPRGVRLGGFMDTGAGRGSSAPNGPQHGDTGGASRFFYVAKPSRAERDLGCAELPAKSGGEATDREDDSKGTENPRAGVGRTGGARNYHPTVKPIALMRYLCRLITPPGGVVLDPFTGSGTTGMAALAEGLSFIGIEREAEYFEIAKARIGFQIPDSTAVAP